METPLDMGHLLRDPSLEVFLEQHVPGLQWHLRYGGGPRNTLDSFHPCVLLPDRALLTFHPYPASPDRWQIEVYGKTHLWKPILEAYEKWTREGKPSLAHYRIMVNQEGQHFITLKEV